MYLVILVILPIRVFSFINIFRIYIHIYQILLISMSGYIYIKGRSVGIFHQAVSFTPTTKIILSYILVFRTLTNGQQQHR